MPAENIFLHFETPVRATEPKPKRWPHLNWSTVRPVRYQKNHWPWGSVTTAAGSTTTNRGPTPCLQSLGFPFIHWENLFEMDIGLEIMNERRWDQTVGDRAFSFAATKTWNSLPSEVTSSVTLSTFKQKLKTYLFFTVISRHVISPHIDVQWPQCFCICSLKIMIDWLIDSTIWALFHWLKTHSHFNSFSTVFFAMECHPVSNVSGQSCLRSSTHGDLAVLRTKM